MKFPKLLRKQYLHYSPLWKAYSNKELTNCELMKINTKLYSAYAIAQCQLNKMSNIHNQFNKYCKQISSQGKRAEVDQDMRKTKQFITISQSTPSDSFQYFYELNQMYKKYEKMQKQSQNQNQPTNSGKEQQKQQSAGKKQREIAKSDQNAKQMRDSKISEKQNMLNSLIETIVSISKQVSMDQIDIMILNTVPIDSRLLYKLSKSKFSWNNDKQTYSQVLQYFKYKFMKIIVDCGFHNFVELKDFTNKLKPLAEITTSSNYHKVKSNKNSGNNSNSNNNNNDNDNMVFALVVSSLHSLMSSGSSKRDITIEQLKALLDARTSQEQGNARKCKSYLEALNAQYLVYMQWLALKCLFRSSSGALIVNFREFLHKIYFMNLQLLISSRKQVSKANNKANNKHDKYAHKGKQKVKQNQQTTISDKLTHQQRDEIKKLIKINKAFKLQIVAHLRRQLVKLTANEHSKLKQFNSSQIGTEILNELRKINVQLQSECKKLFEREQGKNKHINQIIETLMADAECMVKVMRMWNENYQSSKQNTDIGKMNGNDKLNSKATNQIVQELIEQAMSIDIILFKQWHINNIYYLLDYATANKLGKDSKKIADFKQKVAKYVKHENNRNQTDNNETKQAVKQNRENENGKVKQLNSNRQARQLWRMLTRNNNVSQNKQQSHQLKSIRESLFLLPGENKNQLSNEGQPKQASVKQKSPLIYAFFN